MSTLGKHWRIKPKFTAPKKCAECGGMFTPKVHNQVVCSPQCKRIRNLKQIKAKDIPAPARRIKCVICGNLFSYKGTASPKTCPGICRKKRKLNRPYTLKPESKIYHAMRGTLNHRIDIPDGQRNTSRYCDYKPSDLRKHIESKFKPGMTWGNYGKKGWHIDHIKPLSSFKFVDDSGNLIVSEVKAAMSLENLQPLWAKDNLKKGDRYK